MRSVYYLTLRQLSGRWRLVIMLVLAALPVVMTLGYVLSIPEAQRGVAGAMDEFDSVVLNTMLAGSIAPLVVLAMASAAFANEIEDKTLANLTLSPLPRWKIAVPKLLASVTLSAPFIVGSALITSMIAFPGDAAAMIALAVSSLVGILAYASAFTWLGLMTTRAIGYGLAYVVLWEGFFSGYVTGVRFLSIRYYTVAWIHGLDARRFADSSTVSFRFAIVASAVALIGFLLLSVQRLRRMDVP